jgi:hypothetical protein
MTEWLFDRHGSPRLILDDDCVRSASGGVIAWISGDGLFSLTGRHIGWYEDGVIYDRHTALSDLLTMRPVTCRAGLGLVALRVCRD